LASLQYGNLVEQLTVTATAAGTTTLTNVSRAIQVFTGSTTQTVVLPNATTFTTPGIKFEFYNESTGAITIQTFGGGSLVTVFADSSVILRLQDNTTSAGEWAQLSSGGGGGNSGGVPSGAIMPFAGSTAPSGWLSADGTSYSTTAYPNLFAAIGYTYGGSGGSFNVPNAKGVFLRGAGTQTIGGLNYTGTQGTTQNDTTKKNGLGITDPTHQHQTASTSDSNAGTNGPIPVVNGVGGVRVGVNSNSEGAFSTSFSSTGITLNGGDTETRPANIAVLYIIKI
jgi:microcystin-dependent protein